MTHASAMGGYLANLNPALIVLDGAVSAIPAQLVDFRVLTFCIRS